VFIGGELRVPRAVREHALETRYLASSWFPPLARGSAVIYGHRDAPRYLKCKSIRCIGNRASLGAKSPSSALLSTPPCRQAEDSFYLVALSRRGSHSRFDSSYARDALRSSRSFRLKIRGIRRFERRSGRAATKRDYAPAVMTRAHDRGNNSALSSYLGGTIMRERCRETTRVIRRPKLTIRRAGRPFPPSCSRDRIGSRFDGL